MNDLRTRPGRGHWRGARKQGAVVAFLALVAGTSIGCSANPRPAAPNIPPPPPPTVSASAVGEVFLDDLEKRSFHYFYDNVNRENGLVPDRAPTPSFSSIAAVGFALGAWPIGVERGYISRDEAAELTLAALRFFANSQQGPEKKGQTGHQGFYYHFLDMKTGERFGQVELSTIDTTLLLGGVLFAQGYFDGEDAREEEIRRLADEIYLRVDWPAMIARPPLVSMGWTPEKGLLAYDWRGLNEAMLLYVLALGSPTHPIGEEAWPAYFETARWDAFYGYEHLQFAPLFGHHYSQAFIDFRGIRDEVGRKYGLDYFENSRRATLSQQAYAIANPKGFEGYGAELWGLSACDGPADAKVKVRGKNVRFMTYAARGAAATEVRDDGTLSPSALMGSLPFAPEVVLPSLEAMKQRFGDDIYGRWGFVDAFNLTLEKSDKPDLPLHHGRRVPGVGWFDIDVLGIDQGVSLLMIENYRSGLVWRVLRENQHLRRGLERAGFAGGWLEEKSSAGLWLPPLGAPWTIDAPASGYPAEQVAAP